MDAEYSYENDDLLLAKNALLFLVVWINGYGKISIAYFLINGGERTNLLTFYMTQDVYIYHLCCVTLESFDVAS